MMKRIALLFAMILLVLCALPVQAEDAVEILAVESTDQPLYEDESVSIRIADWMVKDQQILISFAVEKKDPLTCILMSNETAANMDGPWEPSFSLQKDIQSHSFGSYYYTRKPGDTEPCDFVWDVGEIYDRSTYELNFREQSIPVRICEVNGFPAGCHVGITFAATALDPYYLSVGGKEDENLRIINLQIVAPSDS